ncbi:MAG: PH domain-containing protein, partial [Flavobacterium sp.]
VEQNYFQKIFDICSLKISQVAGEDNTNKKSGLQIPGCSFEEKEALLNLLMAPHKVDYHTVLKYNYRYLGFRIFLLIGIPLAIFTLIFRTELALNTFFLITCSYTIVMILALYRLYKVGRLYVSDSFIVMRKGIWDLSYTYLEPHKIQKIVLSQLWWQESADVGSMHIYTAGGIVSFSTTQYSELVRLRDEWLYRVESTNLQWM